jgi:hypothetical protein
MFRQRAVLGPIVALLLLPAIAHAEDEEKEPLAELEIGAASEWGIPGGDASFGPSAAIEVTPIKERLEIELGVSPLFSRHQAEWDTELLFRTPVFSSGRVEIMLGAGPEWRHQTGGENANSVAGVASLDFQFWQLPEKRFGWFLEPSYAYSFGRSHEQSLGVTVGLLIALPQ